VKTKYSFYGTTEQDGAYGYGTVFEVDISGKETVLHSFKYPPDGEVPTASVILDSHHNLYGTTSQGGTFSWGTIFKIDAKGKETVLYSFTNGDDGAAPQAGLVLDAEGNLYGTNIFGGDSKCNDGSGCGVVFKLDTAGRLSVLHTFTGKAGKDGAFHCLRRYREVQCDREPARMRDDLPNRQIRQGIRPLQLHWH
jgi:uncharacterized repeat protein (TIGR03803 family)